MNTTTPTDEDRRLLREAIELARYCPRSDTAFSVGALIVAEDGTIVATGYSRRADPVEHAEEAALDALDPADPRLATATIYSSLEPCSARASRPVSCTRRILDAGIPRVVFAWREPTLFVDCDGAEQLREAGRTVVEIPDLAPQARAINAHLLGLGE